LYGVYAARCDGQLDMFAIKTYNKCGRHYPSEVENISPEKFQRIIRADGKTVLNCLYKGLGEVIREIERIKNDRSVTGTIEVS